MSLQAWLPFNGNSDNFGLNTISITGTPSYDSNGKIGACLQSQVTLSNYATYLQPSHTNSISIACWIKSSSCDYIIACSAFELSCSSSWVCFRLGNGSSNTYQALASIKPLADTWNHIVGIWNADSKQVLCYLNGELVASTQCANNIDFNTIAASSRLPWNGTNVKINDFRIYNHALSAKEVKDLAKGLVLHYRLAGPGGTNLYKDMSNFTLSGSDYSSASTRTLGKIVVNAGGTFNAYGWAQSYMNPSPTDIINSTKTYTISADIRTTGLTSSMSAKFSFDFRRSDHSQIVEGKAVLNPKYNGQWHRYSATLTGTAQSQTSNLVAFSGSNCNGLTIEYKNFKLEEGAVATPWCPASEDMLYNAMGYNNNIEYDCSGYRRNGTKSETIIWDIDSPRYTTSYNFNTGSDYIKTNFSATMDELSISFWVKPSSSNGGYSIICSNYNNPSGGLWIATNCEGDSVWTYCGAYMGVSGSLENNVWHHCVYTFKNGVSKWYINGEEKTLTRNTYTKTTLPITNLTIGNSYTGTSWNTKRYGNLSDFRLYSTALSAEDIAELYHSAVIVDNTGKSYAYEYFEAN